MDLFTIVGESEELLEPSPDEIFSNASGMDFSEESAFDSESDEFEEPVPETPDAEDSSEIALSQVSVIAIEEAPIASTIAVEKTAPAKGNRTMSAITSDILLLSDAEFAALVKAREDKKKEGLKAEMLEAIHKSLESASYEELIEVEAFLRRGCTSVPTPEAKASPKVGASGATRKRFNLKTVHTVENLIAALAKGSDYKVNEILQAVGVVEGMDLNGAATLDAYVFKYKINVLKKAIANKQIATSGEKTLMTYSLV
jgi:hypothetical protein